jgi:uncharacterized protein (TIGR02246 family)
MWWRRWNGSRRRTASGSSRIRDGRRSAKAASCLADRLPCVPGPRKLRVMTKPPIEDRIAIEDLYADYCWALDSGNIPAFLNLFTDDAVFGDTAGNRYTGHEAIRGYLNGLVTRPEFRGRQHIISSLRYTANSDSIGVTAFWHVFKWAKTTGGKTVEVSGHSDDAFVKMTGRWWFKQRIVHYWNDTDLPWAGPAAR